VTVYRGQLISVDKLTDEQLANTLWPSRAALLVGSFPHALQMDEIAKAIKYNAKDTLYYKRLDVERRRIYLKGTKMPDGKVLTEDHVAIDRDVKPLKGLPEDAQGDEQARQAGWAKIDLANVVNHLKYAQEWEEEQNPVRQLLLDLGDRLVMRLPKPVRGDYPDLFKELPDLQGAIDKIEKEGKAKQSAPRRHKDLSPDDFDPFGSGTKTGSDSATGGTGPGGGSGVTGAGGDPNKAAPETSTPDFCAVRFLDLSLNLDDAAGSTYEYRVRVVLHNPNYKQVESVIVPEFAKYEELLGKWSGGVRVTFPEDAYVYADERPSKADAPKDFDNYLRVPVQVHKWLGFVPRQGATERVGEWWVDRVLAGRGEFIGRNMFVKTDVPPYVPPPPPKKDKDEKEDKRPPKPELPPILNPYTSGETPMIFWNPTTPEADEKGKIGIDTIVPRARTDALQTNHLLVDFDGGRMEQHRFGTRFWNEEVPAEILVVEPDGRLTAHTLLQDKEDDTRKTRVNNWRKWFREVESKRVGKSPAKGGGLFDK
jgi:hypothetical protein